MVFSCCTFSGTAFPHCYWCCWFGPLLRRIQYVRVFLMEVRNLTTSCSRPIRADHREEPATPPPPPEGREIPPWKREEKR